MITLKNKILSNVNCEIFENSLRQVSIRKGAMIEFSTSGYQKIENKYFYANENEKYFLATRIRYPFENILPRLILKFDKSNFCNFKIRYSLVSSVYFFILCFALLLFLYFYLFDSNFNGDISIILILFSIQIISTIIEYRLSIRTINRILKQ